MKIGNVGFHFSRVFLLIFLGGFHSFVYSQSKSFHPNAHAHNDYEHKQPLWEALGNGFSSVEADVHLKNGKLFVAHNQVSANSSTLEQLYLHPLDSILKTNKGFIYPNEKECFYLMIDIKTESESTYRALIDLFKSYPALLCPTNSCPVKVFLSGERPLATIVKEGYLGLGIDGRPEDLGKSYLSSWMPVISDTYKNWSAWNGISVPTEIELKRIKDLAHKVHAEGKKFRLWAIPDKAIAWQVLLGAGVDLINTDHLQKLNEYLSSKGL